MITVFPFEVEKTKKHPSFQAGAQKRSRSLTLR